VRPAVLAAFRRLRRHRPVGIIRDHLLDSLDVVRWLNATQELGRVGKLRPKSATPLSHRHFARMASACPEHVILPPSEPQHLFEKSVRVLAQHVSENKKKTSNRRRASSLYNQVFFT